ncbi:MAG TPA: cytochrome c biogenesis protein CcdA [Bacteroidales bacterium]|nr:cytochrome c biogenesis protein CcdA [Bacteroidales bacterium]
MKRGILAFFLLISVILPGSSQVIKPVKWAFSAKQVDATHVDLIFKATISKPWHMYGLNIPEGGPIPASLHFDNPKGFEITGKPTQSPKPEVVDDEIFNMKLELHNGQVTFTQRIKKTGPDSIVVKGTVEYMTCSDMQCIPGEQDFEFRLEGTGKKTPVKEETAEITIGTSNQTMVPDTADSVKTSAVADTGNKQKASVSGGTTNNSGSGSNSLWSLFFFAMVAGLGGLLTPCVYPMIPMTVSYFLRGEKSRSKAISEALVFGLSIILLYTLIGVLVAVVKNPNAVNNFTTHWATNLVFFSIFIILAASFFGMFEITLPSGFANKIDRQADKGGYVGAFFMAVAMAVLSFSCTGPIVASLLIKASQGEVLEPIIGMAGFSIVFALPFTLFAIFPSWLQSLPKSGGWLNSVKIFFAFIMLAFSMYFIGKIDQTYHLNLISRELFLSIWIVIFTLLGIYLLGKIKFAHDSDVDYVGVPRFILSVASFSFALYLFSGLLGSDLKAVSTIVPPASERKVTTQVQALSATSNEVCSTPSYSDMLSIPQGLQGYFKYSEALACAKQQKKPVLVDFVGHTCSNCKKMYAEVWSDPRVQNILREKFIIVALYTDDRTKLPEPEWVTSADGKVKNTMGKVNQELQVTRFNSNALPLYAVVNGDDKNVTDEFYTYSSDVDQFIAWLNKNLEAYNL